MPLLNDAGLSRPTDQDRRGWVWIVTILSIIYSLCFLGARIFGKYGLLWFDDAVLGVAYVLSIAYWALSMKALSLGLGVDLPGLGWLYRAGDVSSLLFASRLLWIASLYMTKAALLIFNRKIFSGSTLRDRVSFYATAAVITVCFVGAMIAFGAGCEPDAMLGQRIGSFCSASTARFIVVCVLDIISEITLFVMPVYLLVPINMQRDKKIVVIVLYACRFFTTALFIAQTAKTMDFVKNAPASVDAAPVLILQELTLCSSFITCTTPCLRSFVSAFSSGGVYGAATVKGGSYALQSMKKGSNGRSQVSRREPEDMHMRGDSVHHGADAVHERGDETSIASDGSEQMIIRRETRVAVQYALRDKLS